MDNITLKTEYIPIDQIQPNPRNAKKHPKEQVESLAASLSEFKLCRPLGIRGENNQLVYGHCTLAALKRLNYAGAVPCVRLNHLTDEQCRAYALADNMTAELGDWDGAVLGEELTALAGFGFGMERFGFDAIDDEPEPTEDDYEVELPKEPRSKIGDVYALGEHRLMCGDSTHQGDMAILMNGCVADMLLTDPPYNVDYEGSTNEKLKMQNDAMSDAEYSEFLKKAFVCAAAELKQGGAFYIWHADTQTLITRKATVDAGLKVKQCLIWAKNTFVLGRQDYQWQHEPCLYGWKEGAAHYFTKDRSQTTVFNIAKPTRNEEHPTMKPIELLSPLIANSSRKGETVLDTFGGSGSTLIACEQLGRRCYTMEIDPKYCDVIIDRWEKLTGQKAEKVVPCGGAWQR